jgi:uncharacterized zinc-type alcohol dehydrogenase-like protein
MTQAYAAYNPTEALGPYQFETRPTGPEDVRIEILYSGICHSDIHSVRNEWGGAHYPMVPGHEIVGRITEVGAAVTAFKVGDLAGVGCMVDACGHCESCQADEEQYCHHGFTGTYNSPDKKSGGFTLGGYAEHIVVDQAFALHIPDNLPLEQVAPLLCAGITTYSPLRHVGVGKGHRVGVVGLGGLGHMAVKFAAAFGAEVTMLSTSRAKEADARRLGAEHFALTTDPDTMQQLFGHFDFIIDTVSAPHDQTQLLGLLRLNGTLIVVGAPPEPMAIPAFSLIFGRKRVMGSLIGGIRETQEMLDYCAEHQITSDVEVIPVQQVNEAYARMLKGDVRYRFVIDTASFKTVAH